MQVNRKGWVGPTLAGAAAADGDVRDSFSSSIPQKSKKRTALISGYGFNKLYVVYSSTSIT